jgi:hypothetical protein
VNCDSTCAGYCGHEGNHSSHNLTLPLFASQENERIRQMMKVTPLLFILAVGCAKACPYSELTGGVNPHEGNEESAETIKDARDLSGSNTKGRLLQERFVGTVEEAIAAARAEIIILMEQDDRLGPKFVRLGFHDCVGGCDGCVSMSNPDNAGLGSPIGVLSSAAIFFENQLTRADVWALAALSAADAMQQNDNSSVDYGFNYYGRTTCSDQRGGPEVAMPSAHLATDGLVDFFSRAFGFSSDETVAIMGAHTL